LGFNLRDFRGHVIAQSGDGLLPEIFCLVAIRFRQLDLLRCSLLLLVNRSVRTRGHGARGVLPPSAKVAFHMPDIPTIEELERRLDELCDQYLKRPHTKEMQREIIDLARRLDELKDRKKKE